MIYYLSAKCIQADKIVNAQNTNLIMFYMPLSITWYQTKCEILRPFSSLKYLLYVNSAYSCIDMMGISKYPYKNMNNFHTCWYMCYKNTKN